MNVASFKYLFLFGVNCSFIYISIVSFHFIHGVHYRAHYNGLFLIFNKINIKFIHIAVCAAQFNTHAIPRFSSREKQSVFLRCSGKTGF